MTYSTFAISLQSVIHVDRGNGVAAALKRFERGRSSGYMGAADSISLMQGGLVQPGSNSPILGQTVFGRVLLLGHQLDEIALKQESGRCNYEITVPTQH